MSKCVDQVVGDILAGWRYDISGIAPEMRGDYEQHFAECPHCSARQRLHRTIDIGLIAVATVSAALFLIAFGAIRHYDPNHAHLLEFIALAVPDADLEDLIDAMPVYEVAEQSKPTPLADNPARPPEQVNRYSSLAAKERVIGWPRPGAFPGLTPVSLLRLLVAGLVSPGHDPAYLTDLGRYPVVEVSIAVILSSI